MENAGRHIFIQTVKEENEWQTSRRRQDADGGKWNGNIGAKINAGPSVRTSLPQHALYLIQFH